MDHSDSERGNALPVSGNATCKYATRRTLFVSPVGEGGMGESVMWCVSYTFTVWTIFIQSSRVWINVSHVALSREVASSRL